MSGHASMALRRPRRSIVVAAGQPWPSDRSARTLATSLEELGVDTVYLGREDNPTRIAAAAAKDRADSVELCIAGNGGVLLLRALLRRLTEIDRRSVTIVVHRAPWRNAVLRVASSPGPIAR